MSTKHSGAVHNYRSAGASSLGDAGELQEFPFESPGGVSFSQNRRPSSRVRKSRQLTSRTNMLQCVSRTEKLELALT